MALVDLVHDAHVRGGHAARRPATGWRATYGAAPRGVVHTQLVAAARERIAAAGPFRSSEPVPPLARIVAERTPMLSGPELVHATLTEIRERGASELAARQLAGPSCRPCVGGRYCTRPSATGSRFCRSHA